MVKFAAKRSTLAALGVPMVRAAIPCIFWKSSYIRRYIVKVQAQKNKSLLSIK